MFLPTEGFGSSVDTVTPFAHRSILGKVDGGRVTSGWRLAIFELEDHCWDAFILSASSRRDLQLDLNSDFSFLSVASLRAFMQSSAAVIASWRASSLFGALAMRDRSSYAKQDQISK